MKTFSVLLILSIAITKCFLIQLNDDSENSSRQNFNDEFRLLPQPDVFNVVSSANTFNKSSFNSSNDFSKIYVYVLKDKEPSVIDLKEEFDGFRMMKDLLSSFVDNFFSHQQLDSSKIAVQKLINESDDLASKMSVSDKQENISAPIMMQEDIECNICKMKGGHSNFVCKRSFKKRKPRVKRAKLHRNDRALVSLDGAYNMSSRRKRVALVKDANKKLVLMTTNLNETASEQNLNVLKASTDASITNETYIRNPKWIWQHLQAVNNGSLKVNSTQYLIKTHAFLLDKINLASTLSSHGKNVTSNQADDQNHAGFPVETDKIENVQQEINIPADLLQPLSRRRRIKKDLEDQVAAMTTKKDSSKMSSLFLKSSSEKASDDNYGSSTVKVSSREVSLEMNTEKKISNMFQEENDEEPKKIDIPIIEATKARSNENNDDEDSFSITAVKLSSNPPTDVSQEIPTAKVIVTVNAVPRVSDTVEPKVKEHVSVVAPTATVNESETVAAELKNEIQEDESKHEAKPVFLGIRSDQSASKQVSEQQKIKDNYVMLVTIPCFLGIAALLGAVYFFSRKTRLCRNIMPSRAS